ncbi:MAG: glycosyltransferase family 2 protein [bacterium]|nr:glycosyltransferase family 2 protein [bacterium]
MKISIIIPAYNVERFLALCLDSVLAQTYPDWEALLIDDGSTDKTPEICDEYAERDHRIRVWHKENEGLSDTRRFALSFVTGDYVLCVDSDDCIHPQYLERALGYTTNKRGWIIQMGHIYVSEDFVDYNREFVIDGKYCELSPLQAIRTIDEDEKIDVDGTGFCVVWGKFYPRELFEKVKFPKGVRLHEDQRINHRLYALAKGIVYDSAPMYFYRTREQSLIRKSWRPERLYIVECYQDRLECVKEYKDSEEGKRLIELVYRRLLICLIRNYAQMRKNLRGQERRDQSKRLSALYRQLWRENGDIALPPKKKPVLSLFRICPVVVAWLFRIRG